jgi:hypothetical protein
MFYITGIVNLGELLVLIYWALESFTSPIIARSRLEILNLK